jgi:hypothetical protein
VPEQVNIVPKMLAVRPTAKKPRAALRGARFRFMRGAECRDGIPASAWGPGEPGARNAHLDRGAHHRGGVAAARTTADSMPLGSFAVQGWVTAFVLFPDESVGMPIQHIYDEGATALMRCHKESPKFPVASIKHPMSPRVFPDMNSFSCFVIQSGFNKCRIINGNTDIRRKGFLYHAVVAFLTSSSIFSKRLVVSVTYCLNISFLNRRSPRCW